MFKFTFNFRSSPATNPFAAQAQEHERVQRLVAPQTVKYRLPAPPRRPSPPPPVSHDMPRTTKRGWVPTSNSATKAISQSTLTTGWIDTPAKYLAQASMSREGEDEDECPPAKRRKTLADSIISTAFSAALIGTAVGMTAYRMWRDRGKTPDEPPSTHNDAPPPYQTEEWVEDMPRDPPANQTSKPHRKPRSTARRVPRHRRTPTAISPTRSPLGVVSPLTFTLPKQEESRDDRGELEDQMDWMSDKIRHLIEEGQKALGKEVVIKTDEQVDEDEGAIDDGMEGWEEEGQDSYAAGPSSIISSRTKTTKPLAIKAPASPFNSHNQAFPASYNSVATYPRTKRSRYTAGRNDPDPSRLGSSNISISSATKLGRRPADEGDFKIMYEPAAFPSDFHASERPSSEDDDNQLLTRGIDAVRKAYKIH